MKKEIEMQYTPEMAKAYALEGEESALSNKVELPNVLHAWNLSAAPTMKIIDLGCGTGKYTRILQKLTGGTVVGHDLAPAMIQAALEQEIKAPQGIRYFIADLSEAPIKEPGIAALAPYDFAYSGWTYCHAGDLPTLQAMAKSTSDLLKPGGVLVGEIANPFLPPSKCKLLERYNIVQTFEGTGDEITDGRVYHVSWGGEANVGTCMISAYIWTAGTFEKVFRAAGFAEFAWVPGPILINADSEEEARFYDVYVQNPGFAFFRARKQQ